LFRRRFRLWIRCLRLGCLGWGIFRLFCSFFSSRLCFALTLDIFSALDKSIGWDLRRSRCHGWRGLCGFRPAPLVTLRSFVTRVARARIGKLLTERVSRDVVDRAGYALHLKPPALEKLKQLLVFHSEVFGKLVDANAHIIQVNLWIVVVMRQ
jgi:hypothetical protein